MRLTAHFGAILVFGSLAYAADPQLLNMVMPDAKVLAGVNVQQASISPFGRYVLAQMSANGNHLQDFVAMTGFNPAQDVTEMLMATSADKTNPSGLVLARGNFNVDALLAAALKDGKHQSADYAGAKLLTATEPKAREAVAFIGSNIAVAGDIASVKAALDRRSQGNAIDTNLAALANSLSTTQDAWSVSIASLSSLLPGDLSAQGGPAQQLAIFKSIQQSSGGVKFGETVQVTGQATTSDPKDAAALGDVIRFVAAMVNSATGNPQAQAAAQLLQGLTVTTSGATVNLALSIPEAQIETLLQAAHHPRTELKNQRTL